MSNSKIMRAPIRFTFEDYSHCSNCIDIVEYLLSSDADCESLHVIHDDIEYLARLLYREFNIMSEVIGSSECSDIDI